MDLLALFAIAFIFAKTQNHYVNRLRWWKVL